VSSTLNDVSTSQVDRKPFFASPKNQKRILLGAAGVLVAGAIVAAFSFLGNTAESLETPVSKKPAQTFTPQKPVAVDTEARRVAGEWILTAVARKNLGRSYDLTHPELRQGLTRQQWESGNIPVVYYPTDKLDLATFRVDMSLPEEVMLEVALVPETGVKTKPQLFFIGLKRLGGKDGPWRVNYWLPHAQPSVPDNRGDS
jgi:hypothetical protein